MSTATYLYCLVRSTRAPATARAPKGLPGAGRPRLLDAGRSLWVVACDAPLARYGAGPIQAGLRDLGWVSRCALAHEAVVEHFAKAGAVVPMKLFTLFATDARALGHVKRARRRIDRILERVAGRLEWGVRLTLEEEAGRAGAAGPRAAALGARRTGRHRRSGPGAPAAGGAGTGFLLHKKAEREAARRRADLARAAADRLFEELARLADDARRRPPIATGRGGMQLLLDAAFLVRSGGSRRFRAAVARAARRLGGGYGVTLSGPWPPYTFVSDSA